MSDTRQLKCSQLPYTNATTGNDSQTFITIANQPHSAIESSGRGRSAVASSMGPSRSREKFPAPAAHWSSTLGRLAAGAPPPVLCVPRCGFNFPIRMRETQTNFKPCFIGPNNCFARRNARVGVGWTSSRRYSSSACFQICAARQFGCLRLLHDRSRCNIRSTFS